MSLLAMLGKLVKCLMACPFQIIQYNPLRVSILDMITIRFEMILSNNVNNKFNYLGQQKTALPKHYYFPNEVRFAEKLIDWGKISFATSARGKAAIQKHMQRKRNWNANEVWILYLLHAQIECKTEYLLKWIHDIMIHWNKCVNLNWMCQRDVINILTDQNIKCQGFSKKIVLLKHQFLEKLWLWDVPQDDMEKIPALFFTLCNF